MADPTIKVTRYFYIMHEGDMSKVFTVNTKGGNNYGSPVKMAAKMSPVDDRQRWYEGEGGCITSRIGGLVLTAKGDSVEVQPYNSGEAQGQWVLIGKYITNKEDRDRVLQVSGDNIGPASFEGATNEQFVFF